MSGGGGMPLPISHLHKVVRDRAAAWLNRLEVTRDARLRSASLSKQEADDLRAASTELRLSWNQFIKYADTLLTRMGDNDAAKLALICMTTEFIRGIGASMTMAELCEMPKFGDLQALTKAEMTDLRGRKKKKPQGQAATAARDIAYGLASSLWRQDGKNGEGFRYRGKHTAVADAIYVDFCRKIRDVLPKDSHWLPPESGHDGKSFESYRAKMLNVIRDAYARWEKAQPPGVV